jgi:hypothetical protein
MKVLMEHAPTPADRLRSLLCSASSLDIVAAGRRVQLMDSHVVGANGRVLIAVPADGALALDLTDGPLPVLIEITDVAPVAMRDRIRGRATLAGGMRLAGPVPDDGEAAPLAAVFDLAAAELTDRDSVTRIGSAEFASASADPLASRESALLCHLVDAHADLVSWLARLVPADKLHGVTRVFPLRVDRLGIVLRLEFPSFDRDARLPFTSPLVAADEAPSRMLELLARARSCRRHMA